MLELTQLEKNINKNKLVGNNLDLNINNNKENIDKIITNILKRGIDYGAKSLNINKELDGVFNSIKEVVNSKELKELVSSSVNISLSQALENQKIDLGKLTKLNEFKETTLKGGLRFLLSAGIEILFNKVTKLNLFKPIIQGVVKNVKNFIMSKSFIQKLNDGVNKILDKVNSFNKICDKWYKAYEEFDISSINNIANELNSKKDSISNNAECLKQNDIIQNMTKLINSKNDKLSQIQLQICHDL